MEHDIDARERVFHNAVREYIIWILMFILLYVTSYIIISTFKRRGDSDEYIAADAEDAFVYRISSWLCNFTLAVSFGAVLLLPTSIIANEALIVFPKSYYLQWVNSSLIHGLWNSIFLTSNLSLFILMPFAYFFTESEGFPGSKKGIMSRVYETSVLLVLLSILACGLAWVTSALLDGDTASRKALFDVWNFYLPYLYSCISLLGVVTLLVCTPVGFARLFTVMGQLVVKPQFLRDLEDELSTTQMQEETLIRRIKSHNGSTVSQIHGLSNGHSTTLPDLHAQLAEVQRDKEQLEKRHQASSLRRNLGYPLVMIILLVLTTVCGLMVAQNTVQILIGLKALPVGTKEMVLGIYSLSVLGPLGSLLEIVCILYLMLASVVGFYSLPVLRNLKPVKGDTPMTRIIGNCVVILILSSALPVLSRTLGITNFNLLGDFGSIEWLGNFYIVLSYNVIFGAGTALCLTTKFTRAVREELFNRLKQLFQRKHTVHPPRQNSSLSFSTSGVPSMESFTTTPLPRRSSTTVSSPGSSARLRGERILT